MTIALPVIKAPNGPGEDAIAPRTIAQAGHRIT
jgi:hypothetical protein